MSRSGGESEWWEAVRGRGGVGALGGAELDAAARARAAAAAVQVAHTSAYVSIRIRMLTADEPRPRARAAARGVRYSQRPLCPTAASMSHSCLYVKQLPLCPTAARYLQKKPQSNFVINFGFLFGLIDDKLYV